MEVAVFVKFIFQEDRWSDEFFLLPDCTKFTRPKYFDVK